MENPFEPNLRIDNYRGVLIDDDRAALNLSVSDEDEDRAALNLTDEDRGGLTDMSMEESN